MNKRCAVLIGVGVTGGLQPLDSPVRGIKQVANLFARNGYDVELIDDALGDDGSRKKVTTALIRSAVNNFINQQPIKGYRLLVVYFSGHGYWKNQSDLWLLSDAPGDPDEAVSLLECADLAQDSGIDNVVLISDACRSTPQDPVATRVRGSLIFPNRRPIAGKRSRVDRLLGAREGRPSYEVKIGESDAPESVFTHCFLRAFSKPDTDMILPLIEDGISIEVVPNRRLEKYLLREIESVLADVNITLSQDPVISVVSDDDVYMARVTPSPAVPAAQDVHPAVPPLPPPLAPAEIAIARTFDLHVTDGRLVVPPGFPTAGTAITTSGSFFRHAFDAAISSATSPLVNNQLDHMLDQLSHSGSETRSLGSSILRGLGDNLNNGGLGSAATDASTFVSGAGFTVTGAKVVRALMNGSHGDNTRIEIVETDAENGRWIVRVRLDEKFASSVLLVLSDGFGVPLAALNGYIGHVAVRHGRILNISYIPVMPRPNYPPTVKQGRWDAYLNEKDRVERLRALAAAAITENNFRIGDTRRAEDLANVIRNVKGVDPMLGLFATYAYLEAGLDYQMQSVRSYMATDLDAELFDVAMLASGAQISSNSLRREPFCPILTQGWNYLRSRQIPLPAVVSDAQDNLVAGPYTMFQPSRTEAIASALSAGILDGV